MANNPDPIDIHVGSRIRMQRRIMGMSQTDLGDATGVTFQQIQKYENGKNRVSSSRLQQFSALLKVPASFFFDGALGVETKTRKRGESDYLVELCNTPGGLELAKAFNAITDRQTRWKLANLVAAIAESEQD